MRKTWLAASAAILVIGCSRGPATSEAPATESPATESEAAAVLDPQSLAALDKMGASLRKLQSFTVTADTTMRRF